MTWKKLRREDGQKILEKTRLGHQALFIYNRVPEGYGLQVLNNRYIYSGFEGSHDWLNKFSYLCFATHSALPVLRRAMLPLGMFPWSLLSATPNLRFPGPGTLKF